GISARTMRRQTGVRLFVPRRCRVPVAILVRQSRLSLAPYLYYVAFWNFSPDGRVTLTASRERDKKLDWPESLSDGGSDIRVCDYSSSRYRVFLIRHRANWWAAKTPERFNRQEPQRLAPALAYSE